MQQFLLSPHQVGVPNSRLRYYLIAKLEKNSELISCDAVNEIIKSPDIFILNNLLQKGDQTAPNLKTFLNYNHEEEILLSKKELLLPASVLTKESSLVVDLATINSNCTNCFTKGYGRFLKGSGSLLLIKDSFLQVIFNI